MSREEFFFTRPLFHMSRKRPTDEADSGTAKRSRPYVSKKRQRDDDEGDRQAKKTKDWLEERKRKERDEIRAEEAEIRAKLAARFVPTLTGGKAPPRNSTGGYASMPGVMPPPPSPPPPPTSPAGIKQPLRRRDKERRDLTKGDVRRLARRGGVRRIHHNVYPEVKHVLKVWLDELIGHTVKYTEHARRKTVTTMDVLHALKHQHSKMTLYGFE